MTNYIPVFILSGLVILPNQEIKIDLNNDVSKKIIKASGKNNVNKVLVIAPKNPLEAAPSIEDLPKVGVIASVKSKLELSNGNLRIVLRGINRVKIDKYYQNKDTKVLKCSTEVVELPAFDEAKEKAILRKLVSLTREYISLNKGVSNSILKTIEESTDINVITDVITSFMPFKFVKKLEYMQCINPLTRASNLINDLQEEINISNIDKELDEKLQENLEHGQREYILKEKLKEINNELGNAKDDEITILNEKVESLKINKKTKDKLLHEIKKYASCSEYSPEGAVIRNYLDTVINLPWHKSSKENSDPKEVANQLEERHYGLKDVKSRIIEYVTLKQTAPEVLPPIICLVGPPGVGKTSIAMSIAQALKREFYKLSVGGLNDSMELIGSRRTYLGASPGKIMQAIIKSKVNNPVILIDEVDKMVKDYKGDPASTMLEILDESQNKFFTDNYIEEPFDISNVLFILTANEIENIPYTLKDRLEIITLSSYTIYEKIDIARNYLLKNIYDKYNCNFKCSKEVLEYIVTRYTKEPGVRELKRILEKLVRKVIVYEKDQKSITINLACKYLGNEVVNYLPKIRDYGIANVLAYTMMGGQITRVEVAKTKGNGKLQVTGNSGEVLKESASVVLTYLTSEYEIESKDFDVHVHFMNASQKKEGPSAGVSIAVAMLSLFHKRVIDGQTAFTGEITLKGDIMPIGGLKEKLVAAAAAGIKTVFIPKANELDLADVPVTIFDELAVNLVSNFSEIYDVLFR
ncbi:MAG: endopeptidase La [Firmicutes bacterium]|nr:endopeptidase La [Bacillota bacterium]